MTVVMFNDRQEFLDELANDRDLVERNIVRVTPESRRSRDLVVIHVSLVATAQVGKDVVCLRLYIGERWGMDDPDAATTQRLETERELLEQELHERGFVLRAGEFTEQVVPA